MNISKTKKDSGTQKALRNRGGSVGSPRKIIFRCNYSLGDIVMLTGAIRDLHVCYPGQFLTDVRTSCAPLWDNNKYITPLKEGRARVEVVDCHYPLINHANARPYHCLHGFIHFLNEKLGLRIEPTAFRGDVQLSPLEKSWHSQIYELTRRNVPFWIIGAGGKHDITIKWWDSARYQEVVTALQRQVQFVQVGGIGHHHPKLEGVIDLRGKTDIRQLVRLVYHSEGVLCGVTGLMHLAAAVETKVNESPRPCVVVAGGREPAHWEAYPHHQFIHTQGALACCRAGGCWRDRTWPLGDGDHRDDAKHLCVNKIGRLAACMDLIQPQGVTDRILIYFRGGVCKKLSSADHKSCEKAVSRTKNNHYDQQKFSLSSFRAGLNLFSEQLQKMTPLPGNGKGVVICGGGDKYFPNAWVCIRMLRLLGCRLPIELWIRNTDEKFKGMDRLLAPHQVRVVDTEKIQKDHPRRRTGGWELKPYSILHSDFEEVLFLDADNVPARNPEFLFNSPHYLQTGAVFWPDQGREARADLIWTCAEAKRPPGVEFESGQILVNKRYHWKAMRLAVWLNDQSDFLYKHLHGDKETYHLAFEKLGAKYTLVHHPVVKKEGVMYQSDFEGNLLFQHRSLCKWKLIGSNKRPKDFFFQAACQRFLAELRGFFPLKALNT